MKTCVRRTSTLALAASALGLAALATGAQAATLTTKCSGKGPQSKAQEYATASCAIEAGQKRNIEGGVRNDKNKPVAAALKVTFSAWEPQGEGVYNITPRKTIEVKSGANGKFVIPKVSPATEETVFIEAVGDSEAELSTVTTEVNVQRLVTAEVKKLGGGKVKVTIKGAKPPFKIGITEGEGYYASGGSARKASRAGVAIFHLHNTFGMLNVSLDAGELSSLYYFAGKSFKP